jgi:hypothetical protein
MGTPALCDNNLTNTLIIWIIGDSPIERKYGVFTYKVAFTDDGPWGKDKKNNKLRLPVCDGRQRRRLHGLFAAVSI